jgi:hypothetical protein
MPKNDARMIYNEELHRYFLTKDGAEEMLNVDLETTLGSIAEVNYALDECSETVHLVIKREFPYSYNDIEYLIANDDKYRTDIMHIMKMQLRYMLRSGGDLYGDAHGYNKRLGTVMSNQQRMQIQTSASVISAIRNSFSANYTELEYEYRVGY